MTELKQQLAEFWSGVAEFLAADPSVLLEPGNLSRLVLQAALFLASAFFSGSETALFSLSRLDLRKLRRERSPHAETLHALLDQPRRLIISILCGNELINVAATANMTVILIALYGPERAAWISALIMVPLLLLLGEATPKTIAVSNPVKVSVTIVAQPMRTWVAIVSPLTSVIRRLSDRLTTAIVGEQRAPENILQVDEFRGLVDEGVVRGELTATERALIYNLLQAGSSEIVEIMTPRPRAIFLDGDQPIAELIESFTKHRLNRVPVYRDSRDNVIGFLHAEDILQLVLDKVDTEKIALDDIMHPPVMVPPTKKIDEMFDYFQSHNIQAACVLSEFGGIDGVLTMNDVLTYVFGQTPAESARPDVSYDPESDAFDVPGDMRLIDFNKLTNYSIDDPRMTSVGGVVFRHLDRLPAVGDVVILDDIVMSVSEMEGNRVARVRATRRAITGPINRDVIAGGHDDTNGQTGVTPPNANGS